MRNTLILLALLLPQICTAQTAKLYRAGTLIGTYPTVRAAFLASSLGDSILLSAHTFNEYNIEMPGGRVLQGTMTLTDTSTIDAKGLDSCIISHIGGVTGQPLVIRDLIITNGKGSLGAGIKISDVLMLKGRTIVRNCHSTEYGGGVYTATLYDHAKLTHNTADSAGGGGVYLTLNDSAEVSYNTAPKGGAVGGEDWGIVSSNSAGVRLIYNKATKKGGAILGEAKFVAG